MIEKEELNDIINAEIDFVTLLVRHHMFYYQDEWTDGAVRRFMKAVGVENTPVCQKKYGRIYMTNLLRYMKEKSNYNTKEEAVEFLMNETNLT